MIGSQWGVCGPVAVSDSDRAYLVPLKGFDRREVEDPDKGAPFCHYHLQQHQYGISLHMSCDPLRAKATDSTHSDCCSLLQLQAILNHISFTQQHLLKCCILSTVVQLIKLCWQELVMSYRPCGA